MKAKRLLIAVMILALAVISAACGVMSVSTEGGELTISVNLNESQANRLIGNVFTSNDGDDFLFTEIASVDLIEPNIMRVSGSTADGVSGTYDLTIDVVDEAVKIEVVAVDVPGVTLDDPRVQAANDELAQAFLDSARSDGESGGVADVAVVADELIFTIKAPLNE
jgi:hypothetical protein